MLVAGVKGAISNVLMTLYKVTVIHEEKTSECF